MALEEMIGKGGRGPRREAAEIEGQKNEVMRRETQRKEQSEHTRRTKIEGTERGGGRQRDEGVMTESKPEASASRPWTRARPLPVEVYTAPRVRTLRRLQEDKEERVAGETGVMGKRSAHTQVIGEQATRAPFFSVARIDSSSQTAPVHANNSQEAPSAEEAPTSAAAQTEEPTSIPPKGIGQQPRPQPRVGLQPLLSKGSLSGDTDVHNVPAKADKSASTTLILRNLPPCSDQQAVRKWMDESGYVDSYDFLLWFPAKKTSRLNTPSYAFVNFRSLADAQGVPSGSLSGGRE